MRTLYHFALDPSSRQVRLALGERKLRHKLVSVTPWAPDHDFLHLCVEGLPPCLLEDVSGGIIVISTARSICEYLADEAPARAPLLPEKAVDRAEVRRLCEWFDVRFSGDVGAYILSERVDKLLKAEGAPEPSVLRTGREHLKFHLEYLSWLLEERDWLAGRRMSLADLAGGAHLSCLDYLGEIDWEKWPGVKDWYQKLKSRPSFRPLLKDSIAGLRPPRHYTDLDF